MTIISSKDLQVLANYNFSTKNTPSNAKKLLGLKWIKDNGKWTQQVIELNKQDVTCWTLFLSFMRIGKLAYTTVSLNKICTYLSKYQWKNLTTPDPQQTNAYGTVCLLAARQLSKRKIDLFKKVAQPFVTPCGFKHYWHLGLNGRFLLEQYKYQLPKAKGIEIRFKDTQMPVAADQSAAPAGRKV